MVDKYAPHVHGGGRSVVRVWPDRPEVAGVLDRPRDDLVLEQADGPGRYVQLEGPFLRYERTLERRDGDIHETTRYRYSIPWFGWLFALPVRALVGRRWHQ